VNYQGCQGGTLVNGDIGAGTVSNSAFQYPAPYGNNFDGARHQILFRAAELTALGFTPGTITELGWNIDQINGTSTYQNFEIKMGCTTQDELTDWIGGTEVVFPAQTVSLSTGWNVHMLSFGFDWDGVSNLVVEVCFDMDGIAFSTSNSSTFYTSTSFNSVLYFSSFVGGVCYGGTPTISVNRPNTRFTYCAGVDTSALVYNWTPPAGVSNPTSGNPNITPGSSPADYTVVISDPSTGCFSTADITVNWYPPTLVSFTPNPGTGVFPLNVQFDNTSSPNVVGFDWQFGDPNGSTSSQTDPSFVYDNPGWYYITLTGTDPNGCFSTYIDSIEVLSNPVVEIPNVFSPNGDGNNDSFSFIDFKGFQSWEMKIYNRWGNVVHETSRTNSTKQIWNPGLSDPADGTYFYIFVGKGSNGDDIEKTGHITLVR
jgi:gliding motility-associated-like protein